MDGVKINMKYYKDTDNNLYAYELDGSQDHLIGNKIAITEEEVTSIHNQKNQDELNKLTYGEKREAEYPDFKEYLDGIVKGDQAQIDKYIADCQAVKAKYPKPTE